METPRLDGPGSGIHSSRPGRDDSRKGQHEERVRASTTRRGGGVLLLGYHEVPDKTKDRISPANQIADRSDKVIPPNSFLDPGNH